MMEVAKMPDRLHKPLAMPIVLRGSPFPTIDTPSAQSNFSLRAPDKGSLEVEITIDQLIAKLARARIPSLSAM